MPEIISKELCDAKNKTFDERFKRDSERLTSLERMQEDFLRLSGQLTEILKNQAKQLDDQYGRICSLEKRPGQWLDRIIGAALSAAVAAAVAFIVARIGGRV